jgi:hypothetical protein
MVAWLMPWDAGWRRALSDAQLEPILLADVGTFAWADPEIFTTGTLLGNTFASQPWVPGIDAEHLDQEHHIVDLRTAGQSVRLRDWTLNTGAFSFALTSTKPGAANLPFTPHRGMHVQLRMGFAGAWAGAGYEVIARGMIDNITHDGDTWWVQCRSMLDALRTRYSDLTASVDEAQFFSSVGTTTTTSAPWDSAVGDDLPVSELSIFEKNALTGAVGVAKVEGDSAAGRDAWWFVYSAKSGASGSGTLTASGSNDWFGNSTGVEYPSGTIVTHYGVLSGKPWTLFARILRSTGAEDSSGLDTLPKEWGCSLPSYLVAGGDITGHTTHPAVADISPKWTPFVLVPIDDMLQWVQQGLGQLNMWPVVLEDQISVRMAYDYRAHDPLVVDFIDDDWIASIDAHDFYHTEAELEFLKVGGARDAVGALYSLKGDQPISRPWLERYEKTIAANGLTVSGTENSPDGRTCWSSGTSETTEDSRTMTTRAHTWYTRIPEMLKLTCRTLRYAPLVPGDLVSVTSRHIIGRDGLFDEEVCMVTGCTPDWLRGQVTLDLARLPRRNTG